MEPPPPHPQAQCLLSKHQCWKLGPKHDRSREGLVIMGSDPGRAAWRQQSSLRTRPGRCDLSGGAGGEGAVTAGSHPESQQVVP